MSEARDFELEVLAQMAKEELQRQGPDHPSAERLAAYRAGRLQDREAEELQDHLAVCRRCTRDFLDFRFHEDAEKRARVLFGPAWKAGRDRIVLPDWVPAALTHWIPGLNQRINDLGSLPGRPDPRKPHASSQFMVCSLVAGLLGCFTGIPLGIPLGYMSHHGKPQPVIVASLHGEVTRGETKEEPLTIELPAAGSAPTLVLPIPDEPRFATYRVEVRTAAGEALLAAETSPVTVASPHEPGRADPSLPHVLAVELPPTRLKPGEYRLRLTGLPQGEPDEFPEFLLRIRKGL